ncbi:MAG: hypothetical protein IK136_02115 [Oscillospiraceae bacterium]|nr:hypothetical protein [Oscillospiraceae bacterium]
MKKRLTALLALLLALLTLGSGCMSALERDYVTETVHKPSAPPPEGAATPVVEVSDYQQLHDAIEGFVNAREENGLIRLVGYPRDIEEDVSGACMDVANNTPMGAYAVYYITGSVSRIVSYYEAAVSITYKKSAEQMASVVEADDWEAVREAISSAMYDGAPSLALLANVSFASESMIEECVKELYYGDPSLSTVYPSPSVAAYPQTGADRIYEITFSYLYLRASLLSMRERLTEEADAVALEAGGLEQKEALRSLAERLCSVTPVEEAWTGGPSGAEKTTEDTAYGALIRGTATSEGFAMAMKLMCDRLGVDCVTVLGRREGADCGWNLVNVDGEWYHLDAFRCALEGMTEDFLKTDAEMSEYYLWDMTKYPASAVIEEPEEAVPGQEGGRPFVRPSEETQPPEETETPEGTEEPGETETQEGTEEPEETEAPEETETPETP